MEILQRPSSTNPPEFSNSFSGNSTSTSQTLHTTRPGSPMSFKPTLTGISPEEDIKSKLELLELNVPGKFKLERTPIEELNGMESCGEAYSEEINEPEIVSKQKPKSWVAPESWAVIAPLMASEIPERPPSQNDNNGELSAIRIYKIDSKHHRTASIVNMMDSFFQPSVLLACPLNTRALEICVTLTQKYFTSYDSSRYRLYVTHGGIEKMLAKDEQPLLLQQNWLKEIGYTDEDELTKLGRDDHSYLFRFVFREVPVKNRVMPDNSLSDDNDNNQNQTNGKKTKITQRTAHLADENLSVIPVSLYKNAPTIESLDLSKNTLLDLPEDFFEMLRSLRILVLKNNCLYSVPPALFQLQKLTHLNLSQNHLDSGAIRHLAKLTNLTNLDLSSNQLESLPEAFSQLKNLVFLNLSTNRLTLFPSVIFEFRSLKDLNLSFNSISAIPDGIDSLQGLRTFSITGNSLTYISPKISNLKHLKLLDVRGNLFQDMSGITTLPSLTELHAQYNNVTRITEMSWRYMSMLYLENNGLTSLHFNQVLLNLKVINMTSCKIAGLPNDFFNFVPNVHTINLDRNQLISLPDSINMAAWLENLTISCNSLNEISLLNFSRLVNLKRLDLHGNNLKMIPSEIWQSPTLNYLNLSSNFLIDFPDPPTSFEALPLALSLEELYLADNRLKTESLYNLSGLNNLTILNLSCNEIVDLEENLNSMHKLTEFYVSDNAITSLPDEIDKWTNLRILHLNGNRCMSLSFDLCRNGQLEVLDVSGNNLKYNISNYPYDWNWAWNVELKFLNLSDNRRLEIKPDIIRNSNSNNGSIGKSLGDFRNLVKLRFLNVARVNIADESVPIESTSLRVRRDWHVTDIPNIGIAQWCGRKASFDTFDVINKRFLNQAGHHVAALFSGRSESLVSLHLYDTFLYDLETEINRSGGIEIINSIDFDFGKVLRRAFLNCNRRLSTQPTPVRCGSTATVLYILNGIAWVANVGDTMAVLSREGQALTLSTRHHSWSRPEIERIRSLGGYVSANGLFAGELDICRAFGYFHLLPHVNANPSISQTTLTDRDEFIIMASYELWTFITYQMAVDLVRQFPKDPTRGAYQLRDLAISYGASKSITIIVFDLKDGTMNTTANTSASSMTALAVTPSTKPRSSFKDHHVADQGLSRLEKEIDPPTGEVTLVFTDIKDSTTLWELYPAPMRVALRMHDTIMRRSLRRIGGYEVKNDGDSFMASFPNIQTALRWTCTVQKELLEADWPQEIVDSPIAATVHHPRDPNVPLLRGLSVRMGMHVGEPFCEIHSVTERMDYTGPMVNFAARVGSAPTGGQIFVTPQVIQQYAKLSQPSKDDIGPLVIYDMGMMKFKGVEKPERLFAVYLESLAARHEILQEEPAEPFSIQDL
jgi:adenylate cyclase